MKDTKTISQLGTRAGCADMQAYTREGAAPIQEAGQKINWEKLKLPAGGKTYCVERVDHPRGGVIYRGCKRLLDLTGALVSLPLLCFPMVLIAALVKLDSPGPALYRQERLGLGGKPFQILKFRSMDQNAERHGAQWAEPEDARVTKVGRFLRRTRLDELPQVFHILTGRMSWVGPRPERPCFYPVFERYIDGFSQRLMVKPCLTGLAQVSGSGCLPPEEKIVYDMEYIRRQSVALDLLCIWKTIQVVLHPHSARSCQS